MNNIKTPDEQISSFTSTYLVSGEGYETALLMVIQVMKHV